MADFSEKRPTPRVNMTKLMVLGQTVRAFVTEICRKNLALGIRILGSLKVIGTDTDRSATCDFLLVIYRPISYRFRYKRRFRSKIANFSHPVHLTAKLRGSPGIL